MRFILALGLLGVVGWSTFSVASEPPEAVVSIDLKKPGEPISKYIYGQFIEHLGRCIYGGLWAEMLQDRKFFYPVEGDALPWALTFPKNTTWEGEAQPYEILVRSPWLILGDKSAVSMDTQHPYVGEHTPTIALAKAGSHGGLVQERLSLVAGRRYVGRIVLAGAPSAGPIRVSLWWGSGATDQQTHVIEKLTEDYATYPFELTAGRGTDNGRLEIVADGSGSYKVGTVSLMPADNVYGWRPDTLARLRELSSPIYRWPGGNFVSGYDWKDGLGDPDRRPPRKNPAWQGVESNDVGIDEFMTLCREIDAEPYIAVNTGLGGPEGAAAQVEYANGAATTKMGRLRAQNGRPEPYGVKWWGIGNEMYGDWQLGHMPLADYLKKHIKVVEAMRAVDPSIRPVAVGSAGEWSREMLSRCAGHMSLLSEHIYWQSKPDLVAHVEQTASSIRTLAETHRAYRRELPALKGKDIRIALDEWNYWYGPFDFGQLGTRYFLQDALGIAAGLNELTRNSDIFAMANYAQTVNVIGAIKTTPTAAELEATGLALELYRRRFGSQPVAVARQPKPLDVAAAITSDGRALTIAVVNPTEEGRRIKLDLAGRGLTGQGESWTITGASRWAHNQPGEKRQVDVREAALAGATEGLEISPLSVTLVSLWLR
jgi:alpha-L-arabinofuranosidase